MDIHDIAVGVEVHVPHVLGYNGSRAEILPRLRSNKLSSSSSFGCQLIGMFSAYDLVVSDVDLQIGVLQIYGVLHCPSTQRPS